MLRKTVVFVVLITALLFSAVGCGGGSDSTGEDAVTEETLPSETDEPAAQGASGTTVSVSSTNGAYPTDNPPDWSTIKSTMAFRTGSMGVSSIFVDLATYDVSPETRADYVDLPYPDPGHARLHFIFTRSVSGEDSPPLVTGKYDFGAPQGTVELTGDAKVIVTDGKAVQLSRDSLEGTVELTAVSDTEVSGRFDLKDKWTSISGDFTAPLK